MSLAEEAQALTRHRGGTCAVALLDPNTRTELDDALELGKQATAIAEALRKRGHDISSYTISRHNRHDCRCP